MVASGIENDFATYSLPKGKEYHELDAQDLHEWLVLGKIVLELDIELDQAVHGYSHRSSFEDHDPDMAKCWRQRGFAVATE